MAVLPGSRNVRPKVSAFDREILRATFHKSVIEDGMP